MRIKIKIISIILCFLLIVFTLPVSNAIRTNCENIEYQYTRIYFVVGIGIYIYGGTWPMYDEVCPIIFLRFGKSGLSILGGHSGKCIDFIEGDKLIGYYPFLNPIGIGFVCGIWIDVEN